MKIVIEDYNPAWVERFTAEQACLLPLLPAGAVIEHIGSTAVPGLAAKDIVDLMIGLPDFDAQAGAAVPLLVGLGFVYLSTYEDVMPFRRFLYRSEAGVRRTHVHMVGIDTSFWQEHLLFPDHLRSDRAARAAYESLKRELALRDWSGMNDYAGAKTEFIAATMAEARSARSRSSKGSQT